MKQIQEFKPTDRFIGLYVYKFPLGNCGGITDTLGKQSIYIPCADGPVRYEKLNKEFIFIPEQRGPDYWALNPLLQPEGMLGPMDGGNLAYSGDSRSRQVYHIHDRFETQAQYNALSQ